MFVGRQQELSVLERLYASDRFEFVGVYGRRRVGKTALLGEFAKGVRSGWCTAVEDDAALNLKILSQAVYTLQNPDSDPSNAPLFADYRSAFEAVFSFASQQRCVFVIDEFPYLARSYSSISSILQASIDAHKGTSKLMLVLCGSSLSFMKEQLFDAKSPLYGRRTAQMEIRPFDFFESRLFFPDMEPADSVAVYGMVGGIPLYLQQFDGGRSLRENLESAFLSPSSILYEEPTNLLKQEVSRAASYNAVIAAIAQGASQHNEIASKAGLESSALDYYLKELVRIGLVKKELPIAGKRSRRGVWRITDNLFRFWYRFVRPRQALIDRGMGDVVAQRTLTALPEYLGPVFEDVCRDWLWRQAATGSLRFAFTDIGRWWGNDPATKSEAEIDIVAVDEGQTVMVGECKWRNEATGAEQLTKLADRVGLAGGTEATPRWLFSREGYTDGCRKLAKETSAARLITFEEMLGGAAS